MIERIFTSIIPYPIRKMIRDRDLRRKLRSRPLRIVIGASGVFEGGWIPTDADQIDLLNRQSWSRLEPSSIDVLLAEHVWEHLTIEEGRLAAANCFHYLKPGGYIRAAVPDGLFPDREFQNYIRVGGPAGGNRDPGHKVVYTYSLLRDIFNSAGFSTTLLEYHDEAGAFHGSNWDPADGMIHRSKRFDSRGAISIVLDARK